MVKQSTSGVTDLTGRQGGTQLRDIYTYFIKGTVTFLVHFFFTEKEYLTNDETFSYRTPSRHLHPNPSINDTWTHSKLLEHLDIHRAEIVTCFTTVGSR
jgi:hydroxyacyl-ACP dehydratase HTD2-like protein with hotdog domain